MLKMLIVFWAVYEAGCRVVLLDLLLAGDLASWANGVHSGRQTQDSGRVQKRDYHVLSC